MRRRDMFRAVLAGAGTFLGLRAVQAAFGTGAPPAAYKAAVAAGGVGEPWLVPPRLPLTEPETARLLDRLAALDVR